MFSGLCLKADASRLCPRCLLIVGTSPYKTCHIELHAVRSGATPSAIRSAIMPMILKNDNDRLAFRFGRQTALPSTSDVVDQLQAQIEQLKFNAAEYVRQLTAISRQLAEARLELARRDLIDAFVNAASPSAMKH